MRRWALAAALVICPGFALADAPPTVWDRARSGDADDTYAIHTVVQERLGELDDLPPGLDRVALDAVLGILERAGAEKSADMRLRFDLGDVLLLRLEYQSAAKVLSAALADAPDDPGAEQGWSRLAAACGHLGDHPCEKRAYEGFLRLATEDVVRDTAILNLAETEMHLGHMREAVDGYKEAFRISTLLPTNLTSSLAAWGLAIALDRSGDPAGAEREARYARELERSMGRRNLLRSSDVYFYPDYEIHWYEGLGALAEGRAVAAPADALGFFRAAEASFAAYIVGAEHAPKEHPERWLEIAKRRLVTARKERIAAEKKAGPGKTKEERRPDGDVTL